MADRRNPCECEDCGGDTKLVISGGTGFTQIFGAGDFPGYKCPVTEKWVDSRKKRREIMAEHNLQPHSSADGKGVHR